jgi:hypothetical protein
MPFTALETLMQALEGDSLRLLKGSLASYITDVEAVSRMQ